MNSPDKTAKISTASFDGDRTERIDPSGGTVALESSGAPATGTAEGVPLSSLYAIQSKIGGGGMGVVYLAKDLKLGRYVALKRLNAQSNANAGLRKRFLNEARAVAALNHIYIVHIYALGEDADGPYIAMEYVSGPAATTGSRQLSGDPALPHAPVSLDRQVAENGQYTVNEAVDLLVKITKAVAYAHANGVIHRDLKPSNILLDETGEPKIVDFGLAHLKASDASKLTVPGEKLLSLGYGAPEQETDASVSDERADIYGLGGILYFAITGQNPRYFREQDIPASLREALTKALATDREQRWPSANAFLEALIAVQSRTKVEPSPAKTTWRCKWCDTVNPVTIRFCSECGWDGTEACPECGNENFVGMQYCGKCGADLRVYESMSSLAAKMRAAVDGDEYEKALMLATRAQGFDPAGPSGRAIEKDIAQLRDHARKQLARRDQLKDIIPMEIRAENYERAKGFIDEYRKLSGNAQFFSEEYASLSGLIVKRDLKRARRAMKDHDFSFALQLCDDLLATVAPEDRACLALRRRIVARRLVKRTLHTVGAALLLGAAYLFALPAVVRSRQPRPLSHAASLFFRPAALLYSADTPFSRALTWYGGLYGVADVASHLDASVTEPVVVEPLKLAEMRDAYFAQLAEINRSGAEYDRAWREQYVAGMKDLERRQIEAGNYHEWQFVDAELKQFAASGTIGASVAGEPADLRDLKQKYLGAAEGIVAARAKNKIAATKKYLNGLSEILSAYTREGDMEAAALVDAELRRASDAPEFKEAEAYLAAAETAATADPGKVAVLRSGSLKDLAPIQATFEKEMAAVEANYSKQVKDWPGKYNDALMHLLQEYQSAGDFSGWEAAKEEIDRFEIDRALHPANIVEGLDKLATLQRNHLSLLAKYKTDRARGLVKAADAAESSLKDLRARFTRAKDMDSAGVVNDEIRRIGDLQEIVTARSEVLLSDSAPAAEQ